MRHRPKRQNYPSGKYGDIDYQERLERYCTYLENKLSKLHQPTVISSVYCLEKNLKGEEYKCDIQCDSCKRMQDNWH